MTAILGLDKSVLVMKKTLVTIPPEHAFGPEEAKQHMATVHPNSAISMSLIPLMR